MRKKSTLFDRWASKVVVDPGSGCWEWSGRLNKDGYGCVDVEEHERWMPWLAHRLSFELNVGPAGEFCVCHKCDNRKCVHPGHLFLGTPDDNMRDMRKKGRDCRGDAMRAATLGRSDGEKNAMSKITAVQALDIFHSPGLHREIADRFGVSRVAVTNIKSGKTWKSVTGRETSL